jgi:hypothetical protein
MAALGLAHSRSSVRQTVISWRGLITLFDLMRARETLLTEERHAEQALTLRRVASRRAVAGSESRAAARAAR